MCLNMNNGFGLRVDSKINMQFDAYLNASDLQYEINVQNGQLKSIYLGGMKQTIKHIPLRMQN